MMKTSSPLSAADAGSRGGAGNNGGDFVIDGFSNGRVPPKDQIQEIRSTTIRSARNSAALDSAVSKSSQRQEPGLSRQYELHVPR
jgi:hypothetical protein